MPGLTVLINEFGIHAPTQRCGGSDEKCCWGFPQKVCDKTCQDARSEWHTKRGPKDIWLVPTSPLIMWLVKCHFWWKVCAGRAGIGYHSATPSRATPASSQSSTTRTRRRPPAATRRSTRSGPCSTTAPWLPQKAPCVCLGSSSYASTPRHPRSGRAPRYRCQTASLPQSCPTLPTLHSDHPVSQACPLCSCADFTLCTVANTQPRPSVVLLQLLHIAVQHRPQCCSVRRALLADRDIIEATD